MKKRLISMLMAVLMVASLLPASAVFADADAVCKHEKTTAVTVTEKDAKNKVPGIVATVCDACGEVTKVTVEQFKKDGWLIKCSHDTSKVAEVQKVGCGQFGLTVSYCVDCGKQIDTKELAGKDGKATYYKVEAALKHFYDEFTVVVDPTCTEDGWGYVVCKNCGDPQFIANADAVKDYVDVSNFSTTKAFEARLREVYDMYQAINPGHKDKTQFVAVTEEMTAADGTELYPAKAASHVATVSGKAYTFNKTTGKYEADPAAATFNAGYEGDKVCPYCNGATSDAYVKGQPITHSWKVVVGKEGSFPTATSYGKADTVKCDDCRYTGAGNYIYNVSSWYLDDAVAATCEKDGKTATYCWIDKNGDIQKQNGTVTKAIGHDYEPEEGQPAKGHVNGYAYVNYETCTHEGCTAYKGNPNNIKVIEAESATCKFEAVDLVPATCNHRGLTISQCPVCGEYEVDESGKYITENTAKITKHVADTKLANVKAATCTEAGNTGDTVCKYCGTIMKAGTEIKALGHKETTVNVKAATCTAAGYTGDTVCSVCKETIKKGSETKALGHDFVNGVCTRCDAKKSGYNPFTDVKEGAYYDAILWAYENGVTEGQTATVFGVNDKCTRAQIVTFLYRAAGSPAVDSSVKNPFSDVSKDSKFYNAIMWAVSKGITEGTTKTTFSPNAACTRAQIVTFLWRYEGKPVVNVVNNFSDVSKTSVYYDAIMWAVNEGVTEGTTKTTFSPNAACTRAQAVTFIYRDFASK